MYVSVKREETTSLTSIASKKFTNIDKQKMQDIKDKGFSNTLKEKRLGDKRRDERVSKLKQDAKNRIKPKAKKPDFNSEKTHLDKKQSVKASKNKTDISKNNANKDVDSLKDDYNKAVSKNNEELSSMKKSNESSNSKAIKGEKPSDVSKNVQTEDVKDLSEIMMMLSNLMLNMQNVNVEETANFEKATALIEELSSSEAGLNLMLADGKIDLTDVLSLEDFAEYFDMSEKDLKQTEDMMNQMKDFSADLLKVLSQTGDVKEDTLQDLMAKLNVFSTEITKQSELTTIQDDKSSLESLNPEEILVEDSKENSSENTSSGSGNQAEMKNFIKSAEAVVNKTAKVDSEGFTLKFENLETKQDIQKINLDLQKNLKANMKTEVFEQIKNHIAKQSMKEDRSEMLIRLRPEELGKVELKIEVHKDQVIAKMNVASQMVKEAIEANLSDLKSSLKDKGFDVQGFDVNVNDNSQGENSESSSNTRTNRGRGMLHVEESLEGVTEMYVKTLEGLEQGSTLEYLA